MASRVLVLKAIESSPPLEQFLAATIEAMSLSYPDMRWSDLGAHRPNNHFYQRAWQREQAPRTTIEHFADSSVHATWIEVQGEDERDVCHVEELLRPVLPVEAPQELLDLMHRNGISGSLLIRAALAHVGRDVPQVLRACIEEALRSESLGTFSAGCTAAALLPSGIFVPILEARKRDNPVLARLVDSTLARANTKGKSG